MASMTIRNIDAGLKSRLRIRAARHGRSMEETRDILRSALAVNEDQPENLAQAIRKPVEPFGGAEPDISPRELPDFGTASSWIPTSSRH
ncbi:MAG: plasmid stabilization protein [Rhizobiaceae bacterium]|nr:plasmid stabilization protein [Rhizobiaceae bacterium]